MSRVSYMIQSEVAHVILVAEALGRRRHHQRSRRWKIPFHQLRWRISHEYVPSFCSYMGVTKNRGTPKWMVYNGKPYEHGWFGGTPIFGNTHMFSHVFIDPIYKTKWLKWLAQAWKFTNSMVHTWNSKSKPVLNGWKWWNNHFPYKDLLQHPTW